jgi:hypothetical protein
VQHLDALIHPIFKLQKHIVCRFHTAPSFRERPSPLSR